MPLADGVPFAAAWRARLADWWVEGPLRVVAAVVGLAVAAVAAVLWLRPPSLPPPEVVLPTVPPGGAGAGSSTSSVEPSVVVVHAAGAVARPGIYRLAGGARVADVVEAAGGTLADADLDRLNLAAKVADGQRVYVPRRGEPLPEGVELAAGGPGDGSPAGPVDLNSASAAELEELPGIGPATARAIVEHRSRHGPFRSVDDLLSVRGIGPAKLAQVRGRVTVSR